MKNQPLISIIIPTYNRADLIGETLDSIIAQTYQNWECIVVDDGSTDHTAEVLKNYIEKDSRIEYHHRPNSYKPGGNGARNYGFDISKGEYINWFDSDDVMHPQKIEKQINQLQITPYNFSVCNIYIFVNNLKNIIGKRSDNIYSKDSFHDFVTFRIVFLTNSVLWKREFINKNNYKFNEELKASQEWEYISKVLAENPHYAYINECLVYNRKHEESISYRRDREKERLMHYIKARKYLLSFLYKKRINQTKSKLFVIKWMRLKSYELMDYELSNSNYNVFNLSYYKLLIQLCIENKSIVPFFRGIQKIIKNANIN